MANEKSYLVRIEQICEKAKNGELEGDVYEVIAREIYNYSGPLTSEIRNKIKSKCFAIMYNQKGVPK